MYTHVRRYIFLLLLVPGILPLQAQLGLQLMPVHSSADSIVFKAVLQNPASGPNVLLDGVFVTVAYDPLLVTADSQRTVTNQYFGQSGWQSYSDPMLFSQNPNDPDTATYGEAPEDWHQCVTIPKNSTVDLCTFTFFPRSQQYSQATFRIIGNRSLAAYTGYYLKGSFENHPFSPAFDLSIPIELQVFSAQQQGKSVVLQWNTVKEVENYGFFIERRSHSHSDPDWHEIAFVEGSGTTSREIAYVHYDHDVPGDGLYEYRLRQQDFDGAVELSPTKIVDYLESDYGFALHPSYPNPVSLGGETTFQFSLPERSRVTLSIVNTLGQEVAVINRRDSDAGVFSHVWSPRDLPAGTYLAVLFAEGAATGKLRKAQQRIQIVK